MTFAFGYKQLGVREAGEKNSIVSLLPQRRSMPKALIPIPCAPAPSSHAGDCGRAVPLGMATQ